MINKVLITSEELQTLLTCNNMSIRNLACEIAKRHCEQPRFSILEWHKWDEKVPEEITEYHPILARWRDPIMKAWAYDLSTKYDLYGCQEWAVLPE